MSSRVPKAISLVGRQFGLLTVKSAEKVNGRWRNHVVCSCGNERHVSPGNLLRDHGNISCGCYKRALFTKHGMSNSAEYRVWDHVVQRCTNPSSSRFKDYGGRGVILCKSWRDSFESFFKDMGRRPSSRYSIDRIDNSRGYEPGNCRWALPETQMNNTRRNRYIEFNGETKTVSEWARYQGISYGALNSRLSRGWTVEDALTRKIHAR